MKEVLKYVCEHCEREYKNKSKAKHHESICWKNPELKTCLTCSNFGGFDFVVYQFNSERYIVCKSEPDLPEDDKPVVNCECWVHDKRTKKEKKQDRIKELVNNLNETGLTF